MDIKEQMDYLEQGFHCFPINSFGLINPANLSAICEKFINVDAVEDSFHREHEFLFIKWKDNQNIEANRAALVIAMDVNTF